MKVPRKIRETLRPLTRNFGRRAMEETRSAKLAILRPLAGRYVQIGYGTNPIRAWSGVLEAGDIDASGVTLRQTETGRPIRLGLPDIQCVIDGTTGQEWDFA